MGGFNYQELAAKLAGLPGVGLSSGTTTLTASSTISVAPGVLTLNGTVGVLVQSVGVGGLVIVGTSGDATDTGLSMGLNVVNLTCANSATQINMSDTNISFVAAGGGKTVVFTTASLSLNGTLLGFYATAPIAKQTGVAVTAGGIHAALVNLGLISA